MAEANMQMEEVIQLNPSPFNNVQACRIPGEDVVDNAITIHRVTSTHETSGKSQPSSAKRTSNPSSGSLEAHTSLQRAKDHAQVTASTSMSIVHVALLKQLLDSSAKEDKYYYALLALVISALVLQVLAGIIALYVAFLQKYFRKYKNNVLSDCCSVLCPCSCRKRMNGQFDIDEFLKVDLESSEGVHISKGSGTHNNYSTCCPWECVNKHFFYHDYDVRDIQAELSHKLIKIEMQTADYEERLKQIDDAIAETKAEAEVHAGIPQSRPNMQPQYSVTERLKNKLEKLESRRTTLVEDFQEVKVLQARSDILEKHIEEIQTQLILKQAEYWQECLNFFLYAVFVLNAFILGFGAASR